MYVYKVGHLSEWNNVKYEGRITIKKSEEKKVDFAICKIKLKLIIGIRMIMITAKLWLFLPLNINEKAFRMWSIIVKIQLDFLCGEGMP